MKLVISQRLAMCLGFVHGVKVAGIAATVLLVAAHFLNPSIAWAFPALTVSASIAAALLYSILVDRTRKALIASLKKLD